MHLPIYLFNYRNGGRQAPGVYDFAGLQLAFAEVATLPAIIVVNESKEWGFWEGAALHKAALRLSQRFGRPYVGLLGWCDRGEFGPTIFYNASVLAVTAWYDGRCPSSDSKPNFAQFVTREGEIPFGVIAQHWSYRSGDDRMPESRRIADFGEAKLPIIVAGDLNETASGAHLPQRDWKAAGAKGCAEKGRLLPGRKHWGPHTAAVDNLIGEWDETRGTRIGGRGFSALAEMAYFDGDTSALVPTVNDGVDPGGGLLIDWLLVNRAFLRVGGLVAGSYHVHVPAGGRESWSSDHRLVTATLYLDND